MYVRHSIDLDTYFEYVSNLQAALGIANLIVMAMMETGMTQADAQKKIWMYDKFGLLVKVSSADGHMVSVQLPVYLLN